MCAITMATVSHTSNKYVLHILPPRPMYVPSFKTIGGKTEEGVHSTRLLLYFIKKCAVTMATVFQNIPKNIYLAHLPTKTHVCTVLCPLVKT